MLNRSRALRLALALAALVATALVVDSALATRGSEKNLVSLNHQVFAAVNQFRVAHGLNALHESPALDRSAREHSEEMGRRGYFSHSSADGTVFWRRIRRYFTAKNYPYWSVGENLVFRSPSLSAAQALRLWEGSRPHRANLLRGLWQQIGVSAVVVAHAPGVYGGAHTIIITSDFGVRR